MEREAKSMIKEQKFSTFGRVGGAQKGKKDGWKLIESHYPIDMLINLELRSIIASINPPTNSWGVVMEACTCFVMMRLGIRLDLVRM